MTSCSFRPLGVRTTPVRWAHTGIRAHSSGRLPAAANPNAVMQIPAACGRNIAHLWLRNKRAIRPDIWGRASISMYVWSCEVCANGMLRARAWLHVKRARRRVCSGFSVRSSGLRSQIIGDEHLRRLRLWLISLGAISDPSHWRAISFFTN